MAHRDQRNLMRRSNGYFYARVQINGRSVWRSTKRTTEEEARPLVRGILSQIRKEVERGVSGKARAKPHFTDWAKTYADTYSSTRPRPGLELRVLARAAKFFKGFLLEEIVRSDCQRYLNARRLMRAEGRGAKRQVIKPGTLKREKVFLQAVFARALEDGLIARNPWKGIKLRDSPPRVRLLGEDDQVKLLRVCMPRWQRWITFVVETGLRLNEARHVQPGDWTGQALRVRPEGAKGGKARVVPLTPAARDALEAQLSAEGRLWHATPAHYYDYLMRACKRAGIPFSSPHDLRHTFATNAATRACRS